MTVVAAHETGMICRWKIKFSISVEVEVVMVLMGGSGSAGHPGQVSISQVWTDYRGRRRDGRGTGHLDVGDVVSGGAGMVWIGLNGGYRLASGKVSPERGRAVEERILSPTS